MRRDVRGGGFVGACCVLVVVLVVICWAFDTRWRSHDSGYCSRRNELVM